jgi:hypothetical protein
MEEFSSGEWNVVLILFPIEIIHSVIIHFMNANQGAVRMALHVKLRLGNIYLMQVHTWIHRANRRPRFELHMQERGPSLCGSLRCRSKERDKQAVVFYEETKTDEFEGEYHA